MPADPATHPFADAFEQLRSLKGVSPAHVARELNVYPGEVSRWRRGGGISITNVRKVAAYFGVDATWLEGLAGYGDNTVGSTKHTQQGVDPEIEALWAADRAETHEQLGGIPRVFWKSVLEAQRNARQLAVDTAHAALGLAQSQPINNESSRDVSNDVSRSAKPARRGRRGSDGPLTTSFGRGADAQQFANSLAVIVGL